MGCTQSKIDNEEAVTRCKERKQFMKEAVSARNAFAAAHSSYTMSLKNTGAALSDFAHGEVPAHHHSSAAASAIQSASSAAPEAPPPLLISSMLPPPPPLEDFHQPLQRAASMPEMKMQKKQEIKKAPVAPTIDEEDEMMEFESHDNEKLIRKRSSSSNKGNRSNRGEDHNQMEEQQAPRQQQHHHHHQQDSAWDFFFPPVDSILGPSLSEPMVEDKQEVVTVNKAEVERKVFDEKAKRVAEEEEEEVEVAVKKVEQDQVEIPVPVPAPVEVPVLAPLREKKMVKKVEGGRRVVKGMSLMQIFTELDDHFLKASESAHEVSKMLEATRLHYHSNFADNRGHIDHSARVMRVITWNRSFKGIPNVDEGKDDFDSEEHETHATVLDKMLAWEKKLYDEVKAGELMKIEYQRKVSSLNRQKKRGTNTETLEKLKAAVSHLHTRYIVDMQSMDSTVSEINRLRDEQLYPKLVQLVDGMATMWETMRVHHEAQSKIVTALKALDNSHSPKETSEHHHDRTFQLLVVVQEWHSQFCKLIVNQKAYIEALNNWLKLNLIPTESSLKEKVSSPPRIQNPPILTLLNAWHDFLGKLPDEVARSAINKFAAAIHTIVQHQEEEMKLKEKCEDTQKELARKTKQFNDWHHKYLQRRTLDELDPEGGEDKSHKDAIADRRSIMELVKKRLEEEEEEYQKHCLQVREKSSTSLKICLPELFRAMSGIAEACSDIYRNLRSISQCKI